MNIQTTSRALTALSLVLKDDLKKVRIIDSDYCTYKSRDMKTLNIPPQKLKLAVALADSTIPYVIHSARFLPEFLESGGDIGVFSSLVYRQLERDSTAINDGLTLLRSI